LITCNADNVASKKTILACGGVEDTPTIEEDGTVIKRFWITL
jgi:predicted acetyltransferase